MAGGTSIEEDLLNREAKLERLDFELSARTGPCFVTGAATEG